MPQDRCLALLLPFQPAVVAAATVAATVAAAFVAAFAAAIAPAVVAPLVAPAPPALTAACDQGAFSVRRRCGE